MTAQQLKNSILQMAVQGKLVPQDPNDEPASVLLQRIKAEKQELIKAGKIKKDKKSSEIFRGATHNLPYAYCEQIGKEIRDISDEIPFEIPESWVWVRHNDLFEISGGSQPPKAKFKSEPQEGYIRLYQIRDYGKSPIPVYIPISTASKTTQKGDILLARYGASLGKVFWAEDGAYNVAMAKVISLFDASEIDRNYLFLFYHSSIYQNVIFGNSRSAQAGFNKEDLSQLLFPIPPLNEQKRIAAKYFELLPYIKRYGKAEEHLTALNTTFPEALKKSILQEAVQGKLVPQNPDDEPASVLLERIRAEKQALVKAGKIKKDKHESVIITRDKIPYEIIDGKERCIADEVPFEIPDSWEWVHLDHIAISDLGKTLDKAKNTGNFQPYLCSINVYWKGIDLSKVKEARFEDSELPKYLLKKGDLLICEGGEVGRCCVWDKDIPMYYQNALHRVRFYGNINPHYFKCLMELYKGIGIIEAYSKGVTIKHLVQKSLNSIYFPLPPLAEQHRIVAKIEEIMPYINSIT